MNEKEVPWTKVQMFDALVSYQAALGEIQGHVDSLVAAGKRRPMPDEVLLAMDEIAVTIVAATVDVAGKLGT